MDNKLNEIAELEAQGLISRELAQKLLHRKDEEVKRPLNVEVTEDEVTDLLSNRDKVVTFCFPKDVILEHINDHGILIQVINHGSKHSEDN